MKNELTEPGGSAAEAHTGMSAADHVDRIEAMVYNALYGDRRAADPSLLRPRVLARSDGSGGGWIDGH